MLADRRCLQDLVIDDIVTVLAVRVVHSLGTLCLRYCFVRPVTGSLGGLLIATS